MTELKRKRGRPPGSGKKKPIIYQDGVVSELPDGIEELEPAKDRPAGLAIDIEKFETPFPKDFFEMSKIDKLQWLTAHPRK